LQKTLCMMKRRNGDAGFTVAELMTVVAIMGATAAAAVPSLGRDNAAAAGRGFAQEVTQELQRARMEAVSTRLPRYAFIFSDRIEIRAAKPGSSPTAALVAPSTADPILRTIRARVGTSAFDVTGSASAPSVALSPTTSKQIVFGSMGAGFIAPAAPVSPAPVYLYINNDTVKDNHPERKFRVDVAPLSGQVSMRTKW
jgi:prepilin-type N-terminal cleavage/methylation domain-containing protein